MPGWRPVRRLSAASANRRHAAPATSFSCDARAAMTKTLLLAMACALAACSSDSPEETEAAVNAGAANQAKQVATSGKTEAPLAEVPAEVLAAAESARPGFTALEAESETRDGRRYFDVGGRLPDGTEVEFDIMEEGGRWRVVETQRDIAFSAAPEPVRRAAAAEDAGFRPSRVIESVQEDGITIFELFGPQGSDPQGRKIEVRWDGRAAEVLQGEWAH
jgi:uncharacterized membrane protein YkoI